MSGYLEEQHAYKRRYTKTFVTPWAEFCYWRMSGVTSYIRAGERMAEQSWQLAIHLKELPFDIFGSECLSLISDPLMTRLPADEGISLKVMTREQGLNKGMHLRSGPLQLNFNDTYKRSLVADACERLLLELMQSNQNLSYERMKSNTLGNGVIILLMAGRASEMRQSLILPAPGGRWRIALITRDGRSWYGDL